MKRQDGVISLVTTIMVSILLITLALGLLVLNNGATQQASDDELSLRAYAAAVGGVEWAFAQIAVNPAATFTSCSGPGSAAQANGLIPNVLSPVASTQNAITCILVNTQANSLTGFLKPDDSDQVTIDPQGVPFANIRVNWINNNLAKDPTANEQAYPAPGYIGYEGADLPSVSANQPPAVELTIVNYATTPLSSPRTIDPSSLSVRNVLLLPDQFGGGGGSKILAPCSTSTSFACTVTVGADNGGQPALAPDEGAIIFIRPMYGYPGKQFHYEIDLLDQNGGTIPVPLSTSTIDVTARSGPVYRRIVAHAPNGKNVVPAGLNYVLFGDQNICKDFSVNVTVNNGTKINPLCPSSSGP